MIEKDGNRIEWEYDALYRLTDERRYGIDGLSLLQDTTFTYDAAGNRETMTVDGQTTTYHYNVLDQLIRIDDPDQITHTYHYDGRGNLQEVFDGTASTFYGYDARDRLTEAVLPTGSVYYDYDADGRRTRQTVGMTVTHYLWDAFSSYGDVVMESDGNDNLLAAYTLAEGQLIAQTRGNDTSYYLADGQHSIRALVDETGTLTDTYDYTAFGELYAQTGTTPNNYLYTSQQYDEVTGLYSLRARYYDPSDGRFLSRDTYQYDYDNPIELNRYLYAVNNPITNYDPSGYLTIEFGGTTFNVSAKNVAVLTVYGYVVYRQYCLFLRVTAQYTSVLNGVCDVLLAPDDALADRFRDVPDVTQPFPPGIRRPSEIDKDGGSRRPDVEIPPRVPKDSPNPTNSNPTTPDKGPVPKGPSIDQFQDPNLDPQPEPQPRPKELPPFPDKCEDDACDTDHKEIVSIP